MLSLLQNRPSILLLAWLLAPTITGAKAPHFDAETDLLIAHFDSKTDVDDVHSVAAFATILASPQYSHLHHHAVAGACGIQEDLYGPAEERFEAAFGEHGSDAHHDFDHARTEVSALVAKTLRTGGDVWTAECGPSDFTAAMVRAISP